MSGCCKPQCQGVDRLFDARLAQAELKDYRRAGPARTTTALLDAIRAQGIAGATVLDIGGGVGAIQHALLTGGADVGVSVDASRAYLDAAREEAERLGYAERMAYHFGDFVQVAPQIEAADIVTLDRVICCYDDMEALVRESAARARRCYGLIFPLDYWWIKWGRLPFNAFFKLRGNPYRIYLHSTAAIDRIARAAGLERRLHRRMGLWQVMLYTR